MAGLQQTVAVGYPEGTDCQLAVGADVDVIVLAALVGELHGADTQLQDVVHVVVQAAVLLHDTVLDGGVGILRLYRGRIHHTALVVKGVAAGGHQTVGLVDPSGAVAIGLGVVGGDVVVIAVLFHQADLTVTDTVEDVVDLAVIAVQTHVILLPHAVLVEQVPVPTGLAGLVLDVHKAGLHVVDVLLGGVPVAVHLEPLAVDPLAGPAVTGTVGILHQIAAGQHVIGKGVVIAVDLLLTVDGTAGGGLKVVIHLIALGVVAGHPTGGHLAVDGVVQTADVIHGAADLAQADAVLVEVVEQLDALILTGGDVLHAGDGVVVDVVLVLAVLFVPALTDGVVDDEAVLKVGVDAGVVGAGLGAALPAGLGGGIGQQAVLLLVVLLLCEGVQRGGAQIHVVADVTAVGDNHLVAVPGAVLGGGFDTAHNAQGVGGGHVDGFGAVDPVKDHGQQVVLVHRGGGQLEEVVDHLQAGHVHVQILIELGGDAHLGQHADTLSQGQHIAESGIALRIRVGQHKHDIRHLIGDLNGVHIQRKGITQGHALAGIGHGVIQIVGGGGVLHVTDPGQSAVAGGGLVKIEGSLVLAEHRGGNLAIGVLVLQNDGKHRHLTGTGLAAGGDVEALEDGAGPHIALALRIFLQIAAEDVVLVHLHGVAGIGSQQRQFGGLIVDQSQGLLGELQGLRHHHVQGLGAGDLAVHDEVDVHVAVVGGGEHAVLVDGAHGLVGDGPIGALGDDGGGADVVNADGVELQLGADGQIVVIRLDDGTVELLGGLGGGDRHQGAGHAAGVAVGGTVDHLDLVAALRLRHIGGGAAAVQVHGTDATGFQHDLSDLAQAAAAGEGLLTAVQNHHHHGAVGLDADGGTAGAVAVGGTGGQLAVPHQELAGAEQADTLDHFVRQSLVVGFGADNGRAVLQNTEEAVAVDALPYLAVHHQQTGGFAGGGVKAVAVGGHHGGKVLHVLVVLDQSGYLILHALHTPALGGIVVLIVGHNGHVVTGDVHGGHVVHHLFAVGRHSVVDLLADTGGQHGGGAGEDGIIAVLRLLLVLAVVLAAVGVQHTLGVVKQIVGQSVAAGLTQRGVIRDAAVRLQDLDTHVGAVGVVQRGTHRLAGDLTGEAVVQEVHGAIHVAQVGGVIGFHQLAEGAVARLVLADEIIGVHIAVEVIPAEGVGCVHAEAVFLDIGGHLVDGALRYVSTLGAEVQQVAQVAGPTGQVVRLHCRVHIGNVHRTEHVTEIGGISVGQGEIVNDDIPQVHHVGTVGSVLLLNVVGEHGDLLSGQRRPVTVLVTLDAGADEVQHQFAGVSAGLSSKLIRIDLQLLEVR